ncbi:MAG: GHMP kinase [Acidobacteria bacterium]|nr:GHMP kinase [Acidobacteriota bacterium]
MISKTILESGAPARVDLAGGTLDIWPLYLFHKDSQTINFAINCFAHCRLTPRRGSKIDLISHDLRRRETFPSFQSLASAKKFVLPLLARLVIAFNPVGGFTLETDSESPAGAGLGGSSALNVAVCGVLSRFAGQSVSGSKLVEIARNVEAQVLRAPAGEQDYYSALNGGVQAIVMGPRGVRAEPLKMNTTELSDRIVLCYTGHSRNSGINNWEVMKAHLGGKRSVIRQFDRIARGAGEMHRAIEKQDWAAVAELINLDWKARKRNYPGITTPHIERLIAAARRQGSLAAKACGAGGGGCVLFLIPPDARQRVEETLRQHGARVMCVQVAPRGLQVKQLPM